MTVKLIWITPDAESLVVKIARVSNPDSQAANSNPERLLRYLIKHHHWSPFEMADACFEINTTRDIGRQILRHRSFMFQEFSQRYASVDDLPPAPVREARMQDVKNRQNSLATDDTELQAWWAHKQRDALLFARNLYSAALGEGIAKEVARCVLPEGLTMSRIYMKGSLRSWIHYLQQRTDAGTQKEHRDIALQIQAALSPLLPTIMLAIAGE